MGLAGAYVGTKYGIWGEVKHAERDFILKDYITRHPEHFQKRECTLQYRLIISNHKCDPSRQNGHVGGMTPN